MSNHSEPTPLLGGIEAGGTKIVCAVATDPSNPLAEVRFPTGEPEETIGKVAGFFREACERHGAIRSLGIGTFGPADLDPASPSFGSILTTPKLAWSHFPFVASLRKNLAEFLEQDLPIVFETDVNAAVIAEAALGAAAGLANVAYLTIGTGIGGGFLHGGTLLHGRMHPEVGHLLVPDYDTAMGKSTQVCPFHASCLEGRASGPAIQDRWGKPGSELPPDHPAWALEAKYLAIACLDLTAAWSPDRILLGGGVSQAPGLVGQVRREFAALAGGYWDLPDLEDYIQNPTFDQDAGIIGALLLAHEAIPG